VLSFIIVEIVPKYIKSEKLRPMVLNGLVLLILVPFGIKTFVRNFAWKDDFTLFTTDVKISENSLKCTTSAGGKYMEKAQAEQDPGEKEKDFQLALKYLNQATSIYPYNNNSLILLGNTLVFYKADYKAAISQYLKVLAFDPYDKNAYSNLFKVIAMLEDAKEIDYKMNVLHGINKINPENGDANYLLGKLYGQYKGNLDSAEYFLVKATKLSPENPLPYKDLGIVYGMRKNYGAALQSFQAALKLDPKDTQVQQNIEITNHLISQ
jgi:tetratricopeptide (TPR) repeat protein